jgi:hypothetical protein
MIESASTSQQDPKERGPYKAPPTDQPRGPLVEPPPKPVPQGDPGRPVPMGDPTRGPQIPRS